MGSEKVALDQEATSLKLSALPTILQKVHHKTTKTSGFWATSRENEFSEWNFSWKLVSHFWVQIAILCKLFVNTKFWRKIGHILKEFNLNMESLDSRILCPKFSWAQCPSKNSDAQRPDKILVMKLMTNHQVKAG